MNKRIENSRDSKGCINLAKLEEYKEKGEVVGGSYTKAWYNVNGERFLYKQYNNVLLAFGEVLYYEASKQTNVNCAKYDFCKERENIGVITYDFLNKNEAYYSCLELTSEFSDSNFSLEEIRRNKDLLSLYNSKYNNLETTKEMLFNLFNVSSEEKREIHRELVKMFCLDTLFWHSDRNLWNYGVIVNEVSDKMRLAPIHDNSHVLKLEKGKEYIKEAIVSLISNEKVGEMNSGYSFSLMDGESNSLEQLIKYYSLADEDTKIVIESIICEIDISKAVDSVNKRYEIDEVSLLWVKAMLNYRQNCILKGIESVKISNSEAMSPNFSFNKRK